MNILDEKTVKDRGYFKNKFVQKLLKNANKYKEGQSHRLWTLATFELWNRIYMDGDKPKL